VTVYTSVFRVNIVKFVQNIVHWVNHYSQWSPVFICADVAKANLSVKIKWTAVPSVESVPQLEETFLSWCSSVGSQCYTRSVLLNVDLMHNTLTLIQEHRRPHEVHQDIVIMHCYNNQHVAPCRRMGFCRYVQCRTRVHFIKPWPTVTQTVTWPAEQSQIKSDWPFRISG
jgi:hypothetical protein